nr:hypothetical protein [Tanacetum cinerariifolium]
MLGKTGLRPRVQGFAGGEWGVVCWRRGLTEKWKREWQGVGCSTHTNDDYNSTITPNEPVDSLSMGDEHLDTIPATKSDEFIKSCVKNLVSNPSEPERENGCDVLACFTTFSNIIFDAEYEFDSSDDQSLSDEDLPEEIFSNPFDSYMEEIDLSFNPDDPMPPSIEEDDDDSGRDILILEELPSNYSLSLPNIKMMGDNSEQKVPIPELTITLVSNQEKSPDLLSHRGFENFQLSAKCMMMIHGKNIPILDVPLGAKGHGSGGLRTMATTIEQKTALDESLVPSTQRLRIGRSNFRLPSDIQSKEATLQVVYDVLRNSPLFKAFQVTADVPEIYM